MSQDKKPGSQTVEEMIKSAVETTIREVLPAATMAASQVAATQLGAAMGPQIEANKTREDKIAREMASRELCTECGQSVLGCHKEHAKMFVGPTNRRRLGSFPGCFLNGIQYLSTRPGQMITVPAENNFGHQIAEWERGEEDFATGRKIDHDSGTITPNSTGGYRPYGGAGFGR
jgi:hypothetical protein